MAAEKPSAVAERVAARIQLALNRNWHLELVAIAGIGTLFFAGIGLIIAAIVTGKPQIGFIGALLEGTIYYPMGKLLELRRENVRLQVVPEFIQFADSVGTQQSQDLAVALVMKLIERL
jgi:hypothetical protein